MSGGRIIEAVKYAVTQTIAKPIKATKAVNTSGVRRGLLTKRHSANRQTAVMSAPIVRPIAEFDRGTYARNSTGEEELGLFTRRRYIRESQASGRQSCS